MNKFIAFVIILAIVTGVAGFFYYHRNLYSKETIKLEILGPDAVNMGEETEYIVKYKNNGRVRVEDPQLIFEYPEHSLVSGKEPLRVQKDLPDIYPGEEKSFHFKCRLFGKEGEGKKAKAYLSYRPKDLSARFESDTTFTTRIKAVPITFEFDITSRTESGRKVKFFINYFSNIDYPLSDLTIKADYPSGFQYVESNPSALDENNWNISSLNKTEGGRIEVNGILTGKVGEQKVFRAQLGLWEDGEFVVLKEAVKGVEIIEPSLYINQEINGSPNYSAVPGEMLHYRIFFRNIGQKPFEKLFLIARLKGDLFDFQTIHSDLGQCEPGDNSIVWDWRQVPALRFLEAGQEGEVEFWVKLKNSWPYRGKIDENLSLIDKITFPSQAQKEFVTKVNSHFEVSQKGYIDDEIFGSEGPLPPRVGKDSFFTIVWRVKNFYNQVKNVKMEATLPPEVKLTGEILPESAGITFDSQSRQLIWSIGDLSPGQGIEEPVQLAFQIALTPNGSQRGKAPVLVSDVVVSGEDQWTGKTIFATSSAIDTSLGKSDNKVDGLVQ